MAENDTRVDALEDEVKVLKGEVRRTLVDLRALLMREDSPLNEGSFGRRSTPVDSDPNEGSSQTRVAITEATRQVQSEPPDSGPPNRPVQEPPGARPNPPQPAYPDQGPGNAAPPFGAVGPGGMFPPQMGPQPWAGWPSPQAAQAPAPSPQVSSGLDAAMAERERRMAEQEQRMAEQERKLADSARAETHRDRDPPDGGKQRDVPPPPKQPAASGPERERPSVEAEGEVAGMEQQELRERPSVQVQPLELEDSQVAEPPRLEWLPSRADSQPERLDSLAEPRREPQNEEIEPVLAGAGWSSGQDQRGEPDDKSDGPDSDLTSAPVQGHGRRTPIFYDEDTEADISPPRRPRQEEDWDRVSLDSDRPLRRPAKAATRYQKTRSENEINSYGEDVENRLLNLNGVGSRVYDEYFQLLSETEESYGESYEASPIAPMDINLVASLVRWASIAKQRVGEDRLRDILELYLQSGHATPGLREVLTHILGMADAMPPETNQTAQECVDLISHLHGILTGALAIVNVPQMKISA